MRECQLHRRALLISATSAMATAFFRAAQAADPNKIEKPFATKGGIDLDVPYVPTPPPVVDRMLALAAPGPGDIHYDLGCGDGRIVIAAVKKYGVKKAVCVDLDPERIAEANANAVVEKVTGRVTFIKGDIFQTDFSEATVLTLYLLPDINLKLRPTILAMRPGTRVVSHAFMMEAWTPDQQEVVDGRNVYYWVVPAKVAGAWEWQLGSEAYRADLTQDYQNVAGTVSVAGKPAAIESPKLAGSHLTFAAKLPRGRTLQLDGKVDGAVMAATMTLDGKSAQVNARRLP